MNFQNAGDGENVYLGSSAYFFHDYHYGDVHDLVYCDGHYVRDGPVSLNSTHFLFCTLQDPNCLGPTPRIHRNSSIHGDDHDDDRNCLCHYSSTNHDMIGGGGHDTSSLQVS